MISLCTIFLIGSVTVKLDAVGTSETQEEEEQERERKGEHVGIGLEIGTIILLVYGHSFAPHIGAISASITIQCIM